MSQKEKNIFQLARIIAASLKGKTSDGDQQILEKWLSVSTKNKKIYDEFKDGKRLEQKIVESQQINWEEDYQHFTLKRQHLHKKKKNKNLCPLRRYTYSPDHGSRYIPTPQKRSASRCLYFRDHQTGRTKGCIDHGWWRKDHVIG